MWQATLAAFCAVFTDKNQRNGRRRFIKDKTIEVSYVKTNKLLRPTNYLGLPRCKKL